jgi:WS/DGAT/MGAT family acyltransferase
MAVMQRLSRTDAAFVAAETTNWHMHVGVVAILDPSTAPGGYGVEAVRRLVRDRYSRIGLFRRRVVEVPGRLDRPLWVDTPELEIDAHLRHARLPAPGGPRELDDLVGEVFAAKLDRNRPLWEMWHVDGLEGGNVALILKVHHACVDGVRAVQLLDVVFDLEPDAPDERSDLAVPAVEAPPSRATLLRHASLSLVTTPLRLARFTADVVQAAPKLARFAWSHERGDSLLPFEAPRSPFNGVLTPRRAFAYCSVPLEDVRSVRRSFGVTVNDVVLAMCAGAMRRYLVDRGELTDRALVAQVPMAIRRDVDPRDTSAMPGNFLSAIGASLPTHLDDAGARLEAVRASTQAARRLHHALGDDLLSDLVAVPPPALLSALVRAYTMLHLDTRLPPIFNVLVSNVPGPPVPLYSGGARLVGAYLVGPLVVGSGCNISVFSYCDSLGVGITVCPDIVDDPWSLAASMPDALDELVGAARA